MPYTASTTSKTVESVVLEATIGKKITVNTVYQRDVVWDKDKQGKFINSVYEGIIPTPLIFNSVPNNMFCIDGKQRITSLTLFKQNKLYFEYNDMKCYYSRIPKECKDTDTDNNTNKYRVLTQVERHINIDKRNIPIIEYYNLSYKEEVDIFNRIQNGMVLSKGELLVASVTNQDVATEINSLFTQKKELFKPHSKYYERKGYYDFIINAMFVLEKDKITVLKKVDSQKYMQSFEDVTNFKEVFKMTEKLLNFMFGPELLNYPTMSNLNFNKNYMIVLVSFLNGKMDEFKKTKKNYRNLRKMLNSCHKKCKNQIKCSTTQDSLSKMYDILDDMYNDEIIE